jgi:hypothetical protein
MVTERAAHLTTAPAQNNRSTVGNAVSSYRMLRRGGGIVGGCIGRVRQTLYEIVRSIKNTACGKKKLAYLP